MSQRRCAVHELVDGESVEFTLPERVAVDNQKVTVTLERKSGRRARLRIAADDVVVIVRNAAVKRPT